MRRFISFILAGGAFFSLNAQESSTEFKLYHQPVPGSSLQFTMVPIAGGSFQVGLQNGRASKIAAAPQRKVTVDPFWMGAFEVSRDAFDVFYKDENTSQNSKVDAVTRPSPQYIDLSLGMGKEGGYPVNSLSQHAALMYCRWLYNNTGIFYRLPTEAEWEYACGAGNTPADKAGKADLSKYAWFKENSDNKFHKSGEKLPNAWGLYDMLGNVSEWTLNHYDSAMVFKIGANGKDTVPAAVAGRYPKVTKGGSYADEASTLVCSSRVPSDPSWNRRDPQIPKSKWWLTEAAFVGFRVLRPRQQPAKADVEAFFKQYLGN